MRFQVSASSIWSFECYEIVRKYECLKDFGVVITKEGCYIEINSLQDLKQLETAVGRSLIISFEQSDDCDGGIEIYDDYRE